LAFLFEKEFDAEEKVWYTIRGIFGKTSKYSDNRQKAMRILGIDPGLAIVGWGVVERVNGMTFAPVAYGAINTPAHTEIGSRLAMIYKNMNHIRRNCF
jgi:hypothetical protein